MTRFLYTVKKFSGIFLCIGRWRIKVCTVFKIKIFSCTLILHLFCNVGPGAPIYVRLTFINNNKNCNSMRRKLYIYSEFYICSECCGSFEKFDLKSTTIQWGLVKDRKRRCEGKWCLTCVSPLQVRWEKGLNLKKICLMG